MRQNIIEALDKSVEQKFGLLDRRYNHSSEIGWTRMCIRRLELLRLHPELEAEMNLWMKRKMSERKRQEGVIVDELRDAGVQVERTMRDEMTEYRGKQVLYTDALELVSELDSIFISGEEKVPLEIKTCSPQIFHVVKGCSSAEDLMSTSVPHLSMYPPQLWTQILMRDAPWGMWLFKDVDSGEKHVIETEVKDRPTIEIMKRMIDGLKEVNDAVKKGEPHLPQEVEGCKRCGFHDYCFPTRETEIAFKRLTDADLEASLTRWHELKKLIVDPVKKSLDEFEAIDKLIKSQLRGQSVLVGDFRIVSKPYQTPVYPIPEEVRKQYVKTETRYRAKIEFLSEAF